MTSLMPHVPHEVVTQILLRLPVSSLLRFSCVSKAWRGTISDDPSFRRDLRLHRHKCPCLLITRHNGRGGHGAGLYRWEETHGAATLVHPMMDSESELPCGFTHCDGLVMVATQSMLRVLNPATGRVLTLPWTATYQWNNRNLALGMGRDPRTGAYKVVRLFQWTRLTMNHIVRTSFVEIFTIGADQQWRQIVAQPPHIVAAAWQIATCFKGSLLWSNSRDGRGAISGFLRFRLEDETFSVLLPPPGLSWFKHDVPSLFELCGELCAACPRPNAVRTMDMWMTADMDSGGANLPQWDKRYTIHWDWPQTSLRPVAMLDDVVLVCQASRNRLFHCILQTNKRVDVKDRFYMEDLEYYNLEEDKFLEYPHGSKSYFDVIPYVPSSVSI